MPYQTMFHNPTSEISNERKLNSWFDTILNITLKTLFNTLSEIHFAETVSKEILLGSIESY